MSTTRGYHNGALISQVSIPMVNPPPNIKSPGLYIWAPIKLLENIANIVKRGSFPQKGILLLLVIERERIRKNSFSVLQAFEHSKQNKKIWH